MFVAYYNRHCYHVTRQRQMLTLEEPNKCLPVDKQAKDSGTKAHAAPPRCCGIMPNNHLTTPSLFVLLSHSFQHRAAAKTEASANRAGKRTGAGRRDWQRKKLWRLGTQIGSWDEQKSALQVHGSVLGNAHSLLCGRIRQFSV